MKDLSSVSARGQRRLGASATPSPRHGEGRMLELPPTDGPTRPGGRGKLAAPERLELKEQR